MTTRRDFMRYSLCATGALALPHASWLAAAPNGYGITGHNAPELQINYWIDHNGDETSFKLADHSGKWVMLKCFQSWCPGCHAHGFPALKKISDALAAEKNQNVVFAGIQTVFEGHYINTIDKVREIQLQYDLQVPMGHDPGGDKGRPQTMMDYRTGGTPWMILISPDRQVVYNDFGIDADKAIEFLKTQTV